MKLVEEIEALKRHYMAGASLADRQMANVTLRLLGTVLGEYKDDRWEGADGYSALTNAHLLRVLHAMGVRLEDCWNFSALNPGHGNLYHVYARLLGAWNGDVDDDQASMWADDYWDDCYFLLALIEGRRGDPGFDDDLRSAFDPAVDATLLRLAEQARADFPNAAAKQWSGPGFHAATMELFHVAGKEGLYDKSREVIDAVAANLDALLQQSEGQGDALHWDSLFAWHIGQVVTTWCRLRDDYKSVNALEPVIRRYYAELIGPKRRSAKAGWNNGGKLLGSLDIMYGTARALSAAYLMENPKSDVVRDAHAFIVARMEDAEMLGGIKARANILETLQIVMKVQIADPELHLVMEIGARLATTGLYEAVLGSDSVSAKTRPKMLDAVRNASRDALERRGLSALQPFGVNAELLSFASSNRALLREFGDNPQEIKEELRTFLSATMTEVRARAARSLLRKLWTRRGLLHYAPFFDLLARLEHMESFFSDYRDHVNHQILVFLLGAYIYYNDKRLRDALLDEIARTNQAYVVQHAATPEEFLFRWKLTSTFHDVGYIFEVSPPAGDPAAKGRIVDESLAFIKSWMDSFLQEYVGRFEKDEKVVAETLQRIAKQTAGYKDIVAGIDDLNSLTVAPEKTGFAAASLFYGNQFDANLLESYFGMCSDCDSKSRPRFYDHGIMSALVLLKTADVQHHHLGELRRLANEGKLKNEKELAAVVGDPSTEEQLQPARFWVRFAHAAGAIALHNIYPSMHDEKTCTDHGLAGLAKSFTITTETPLAYLLAMADGLQDWDRHSFRPPSAADKADRPPLCAHEVLFKYEAEKLRAVGLTKNGKTRYASRFTEMKLTLRNLDDFAEQAKELS